MAKEENKGIIFFPDMLDVLEMLNMEERGIVLTAALHYKLDRPLPPMNKHTEVAFRFIRGSIDRNDQKHQEMCERNRINGSKGGRPRSADEREIHEICTEVVSRSAFGDFKDPFFG